jgi:tetratricopeptide (TPR) repeat protein
MLDKRGKIYLTDFGIAKSLTGLDRSLTLSGTTVGTPDYMSPEQATGNKDDIDHRSDVFSLGATMYHCLTGKLPFPGKDLYEVFFRIINNEPASPGTLNKTIPHDLETICLKCIEKDKSKRYQSALELTQDVKRFLGGEPIQARRVTTISKLWRRARRNKLASIGLASTALILVALLAIWLVYSAENIRAQKGKEQAEQQARQAADYVRTVIDALLTDLGSAHEEALERRKDGETLEALHKIPKRLINSAIYKKAEKDAVKNDNFHYSMGRLYRIIGAEEKALVEQKTALGLNPAHGLALYETGILLYAKYGRLMENLRDDWRKKERERRLNTPMIAAMSEWSEPADDKLENNDAKKLRQDALKSFEAALKALPKDSLYYTATEGIIGFMGNKLEPAVAKFQAVLEKDKTFDDAIDFLAVIYEFRGEMMETFKLLTTALAADKGNVLFYARRALIQESALLKGVRFSSFPGFGGLSAIKDWLAVLKLQPDNYTGLVRLGRLYVDMLYEKIYNGTDPNNDLKEAEAFLNRAVELMPDNPAAYKERAAMNCLYGDYCWGMWYMKNQGVVPVPYYEKALADLHKALELDPNNTDILYKRAAVWINFGHYTKCQSQTALPKYLQGIEDMNKALKINPADSNLWERRASLWSVSGLYKYENSMNPEEDYQQSARDFEKALELNPDNPQALSGYASLLDCWGGWKMSRNMDATMNYERAIEYQNKLIVLGFSNSQNYQHRAMSLSNLALQLTKNGRYADAIWAYKESDKDWQVAMQLNQTMKDDISGRIAEIKKHLQNLQGMINQDKQGRDKR